MHIEIEAALFGARRGKGKKVEQLLPDLRFFPSLCLESNDDGDLLVRHDHSSFSPTRTCSRHTYLLGRVSPRRQPSNSFTPSSRRISSTISTPL